jgi:uncharacterized protein (DUF2147 family)
MRKAIVVVCTAFVASAAQAAEPIGDWRVQDGSAIIRIDNCSGALWGVVTWEKSPGRDNHNPNPSLRGRPTLGATIVKNMRQTSRGRWEGEIYNAQNGKTYNANIRLVNDNTLRLQGCVLGGIFCGGQQWTRVAGTTTGRGGRSDVCSRVSDLPRRTH